MTHKIPALIVSTILLAAVLTGCHKVSHNGHLDGQWQLMEITYADGSTSQPDRVYWDMMLHTANFVNSDGTMFTANMAYDSEAATLMFEFPYSTPQALSSVGITANPATFEIQELTHERMSLHDADSGNLLFFRKY